MAVSPMVAGFLGATGMRVVFAVDVAVMAVLAASVWHLMLENGDATVQV